MLINNIHIALQCQAISELGLNYLFSSDSKVRLESIDSGAARSGKDPTLALFLSHETMTSMTEFFEHESVARLTEKHLKRSDEQSDVQIQVKDIDAVSVGDTWENMDLNGKDKSEKLNVDDDEEDLYEEDDVDEDFGKASFSCIGWLSSLVTIPQPPKEKDEKDVNELELELELNLGSDDEDELEEKDDDNEEEQEMVICSYQRTPIPQESLKLL
jgi:hypothetical protein